MFDAKPLSCLIINGRLTVTRRLILFSFREFSPKELFIDSYMTSPVAFLFRGIPDMLLIVRCHLFYLPREFMVVVIMAMYVLPRGNAKEAMEELSNSISAQETSRCLLRSSGEF